MALAQHGSQKARDTLAYLRAQIAGSIWQVGDLIPKENELMELIGVGKSTIREAVRSLATLGMLETVPGVGTFVRSRSPVSSLLAEFLADHDLEEVLVYRRSLEIEAIQAAAVRRSPEQLAALTDSFSRASDPLCDPPERCNDTARPESFHRLIVEASGSQLLLELYTGVMAALHIAAERGQVFLGTTPETMLHDHGELLRAIQTRSVRDASRAMALHVDRDLGLHVEELEDDSIEQSPPLHISSELELRY